jgi:hypothetical protein
LRIHTTIDSTACMTGVALIDGLVDRPNNEDDL